MDGVKRAIKGILTTSRNSLAVAGKKVYAVLACLLPRSFILFIKHDHKVLVPLKHGDTTITLRVESNSDLRRRIDMAKEPGTARWIQDNIKEKAVLYDIGANVGTFSILAAKNSPLAKVYAFEPSVTTFRHLVFNIQENACVGQVKPFMIPLSAKAGKLTFNYESLDPGAPFHCLGGTLDGKGRAFKPVLAMDVLTFSIDDLVYTYGFDAPTHIKLDVDGIEYDILQGAKRVLASGTVRSIIVEFYKDNPKSKLIEGLLQERGYRLKDKLLHVYNPGPKAYSVENFYDCVFEPAKA